MTIGVMYAFERQQLDLFPHAIIIWNCTHGRSVYMAKREMGYRIMDVFLRSLPIVFESLSIYAQELHVLASLV